MSEPQGAAAENRGLRSRRWLLSYKTSSTLIEERPVDILHDFYIPALRLAVRYDRVAGYFRSSSLAAASQGFSAFVGRQGKMRLIVGADLEPEDVRAILAGDAHRLAVRLNSELEQPESWPEGVKNGVTLLAWMVAHGYLEVRVAFRLHRLTGEPLPFDTVEDGYVHEKWFILYDEFGNRLYGTGTLNESRTALVLNAENIDIHCDWWGERERRRVEEAVEAFENLWQGRVRHMPVMTLPEAVRRRLIRIAEGIEWPVEIDGTRALISMPVDPPPALERLRFAILRDAPKMPGGRFVGMETAPVAPWPHQAVVVRRLIETWPYSYLLCDEVGLGKTIEAGLAFRSLYLTGLVKRILIAAPASLTLQWQRQMASKMLLSFGLVRTHPQVAHEYIFPLREVRLATSIFEPDLIIISTGLLARRERAEALLGAKPFDIALVDEAHAARRQNPTAGSTAHPKFGNLYVSIRDFLRQKAHSLWLATATPMQIDPVEVCDLLALTNRVGAFQFDPTLTLQYYEILEKLVHGQEVLEYEWEFLRRVVLAVKDQDPLLWDFMEKCVIDGRIVSPLRQWLNYKRIPRGRDRQLMCRLLFGVAPLSRVMMRHTRRFLEIYREQGQMQQNLPRRVVLPIPPIRFTSVEEKIYCKLEEYCEELARQVNKHNDSRTQQMVGFFLSFIRLRFASSLYALRETLQRRLNRVEATLLHQQAQGADVSGDEEEIEALRDRIYEGEEEDDQFPADLLLKNRSVPDLEWERDFLKNVLADLADLSGPSSKMQELLRRLDQRREPQSGRIRQTVIFTRFYDTLKDIVARLRQADPKMRVGTYSGQGAEYFDPVTERMVSVDREEVKERFLRGEIDVLVCTDAAAEGLNLQTADLLVNFDLGWNPMKVEQRIGRIDRIGQKHKEVYVLNLCYLGSAEQIVYGRLLSRLAEANVIVGTQQISLLPVTPEQFQQLAEGKLTPEELEARALKEIEKQRKRTESMEIPPKELYEIYLRMSNVSGQQPVPVSLSAIWEALSSSQYLRKLGCIVAGCKDKPILTVFGMENVPDGAMLTVSRELYEEGLGDGHTRLHFASYGDPYFDAILEHFNKFALPPCVRRLAVRVTNMDRVEVVGYAAACRREEGLREVRLIRGWSDLESLSLAEDEPLTEAEIEILEQQLQHLADKEFEHYATIPRIERENVRAARVHEALSFLVIRSLLEFRGRFAGDGASFWSVQREVASLFEDRDHIYVDDLPANLLRPFAGMLLFNCNVPAVGDKADILVPRILGRSAIEAACRLADSFKVKKKDLRLETMLNRLKREAEARLVVVIK